MTITSSSRSPAGAAVTAAPAGRERALGGVLVVVAVVAARIYLAFTATLVITALAPVLLDWNGYVVDSGSMEPGVGVGDVVVGRPMPADEDVEPGLVYVFNNPATTSGPPLVHRVVEAGEDGTWVTQGDANADPDVDPVPRSSFQDQARVLVPLIGRPLRWWREGDLALLLAWLVLTGAALATVVAGRSVVTRRHRGRRGPGGRRGPRQGEPGGRSRVSVRPRRRAKPGPAVAMMSVAVGLVLLLAAPSVTSASATFTSHTRNPGNGWAMSSAPLQRYNAAVITDAPHFYYTLDEASGTTTFDQSDNGRTGSLASLAGYRAPGALPNNFGYGVNLGSTGRVVSGGASLFGPETFSLELWFRTTSTAGGKLIGFESGQTATGSSQFDRHVTMRTDGRLVYGDWNANQIRTVTSPATYNSGAWHHLVLTAVPNGSQQSVVLYVDGQAVTSGTTSRTGDYSGWWRVGYGKVRGTLGVTTNGGFNGIVDQVAVYRSVLSSARVRAHYDAR